LLPFGVGQQLVDIRAQGVYNLLLCAKKASGTPDPLDIFIVNPEGRKKNSCKENGKVYRIFLIRLRRKSYAQILLEKDLGS
jgi:hypothetical protein